MAHEDYTEYGDYSEYSDNREDSLSWSPQRDLNESLSTFKQRNDPQDLLLRYRLQLECAYIDEQEVKDDDGNKKIVHKKKFKKNTNPKATKQGIEDILSYLERFINSHSVQAHFQSGEDHKDTMKHIADDIVIHFIANRAKWGMTMKDCDILISNFINGIDIFLTRGIGDKERTHYGESFKEHTERSIKPEKKEGFIQKVGGFLAGNRGGKI